MCHLSRIMAPDPALGWKEPDELGIVVVDSAKQAKYLRDTVACEPVLVKTADAVSAAVTGRFASGGNAHV
jgi:hypothetical protein